MFPWYTLPDYTECFYEYVLEMEGKLVAKEDLSIIEEDAKKTSDKEN